MTTTAQPAAQTVFGRDPATPAVLVVDGYGVSLTVRRGHLVIEDGIGAHRRTRRYSRAERTLRRVIILARTGHITLDAIRWCHDVGPALIQLDPAGHVLLTAGRRGADDARLRRAQALTADTDLGTAITRDLIGLKLDAQATTLSALFGADRPAAAIRDHRDQLAAAGLSRMRELEAAAANIYFATWTRHWVAPFIERDQDRIPEHWHGFAGRGSVLDYGRSPRKAADPLNAILNYAYAIAEAETTLAAAAVGLDPGLGLLHSDKKNRDSLTMDLLEPLRPNIDHHLLTLLARRRLRTADLHETRDGNCRVLAPLTHEIAEASAGWSVLAARLAEQVAHNLARSSGKPIALTTPLTGRAARTAQPRASTRRARRDPKPAAPPPASCRTCGETLTDARRQLCPNCWPITRARLASERVKAAQEALAAQRSAGVDPTNRPQAAAKRSESLSRRKREELTWVYQPDNEDWTKQRYVAEVLPLLADIPLSSIRQATGLSISACSQIRSGKLTPHRRHWEALHRLSGGS